MYALLVFVQHMVLPSRVLHLPMAFDERWTHEALDKYMRSARSEAPYLPSNVQYIANNNGLPGKEDVSAAFCSAAAAVDLLTCYVKGLHLVKCTSCIASLLCVPIARFRTLPADNDRPMTLARTFS